MIKEQLLDLRVRLGITEWCCTPSIDRIDDHSGNVYEKLNDFEMSSSTRDVKGCSVIVVSMIHVHTLLVEPCQCFHIVLTCCITSGNHSLNLNLVGTLSDLF